jgi:hypothetical protein
MSRRPLVLVFGVLLGIGLAAGAACGGGGGKGSPAKTGTPPPTGTPLNIEASPTSESGTPSAARDAAAIEAVVRAQAQANNSRDIDGFVALFSDSYLSDQLHVSRQNARDLVAQFIGEPLVEITNVTNIDVTGDNATAQVDKNGGVIVKRQRYSFLRENGQWRVAGVLDLPVDVPDSPRTVALKLVENRFDFDDQAVKDGAFVFHVTNAGAQPHEVQLKRLPAGVEAQQLVDPQRTPAGVETIGLFGPLAAGELRPLVFAQPLSPGRYAMICYLPDTSGTSHAQLGMVRAFTVQ